MSQGQIIQGLRLTRAVGEGGMATVWQAEHLTDGRVVALKVVEPKLARDPAFRKRFFAEAEHHSKLVHPHVVRVEQILFEPLALVMEWVDGGTLAALLARGRPPLERVRTLMADITAGVGAAHALQILHRDIKPQNVLLTRDGVAKVADFGLARVAGQRGQTQTGQVMGTPRYMAPEQIRGLRQIDLRADVYSLGVLLYQLLTGRTPFEGSEYQIALAQVQTPPPDPRTFVPDLPAALVQVVLRALAKDPAGRPADARALGVWVERAWTSDPVALAPTATMQTEQMAEVSETTEESALPSGLFEPPLATTEQLAPLGETTAQVHGPADAGAQSRAPKGEPAHAKRFPIEARRARLPWWPFVGSAALLGLMLLGVWAMPGAPEVRRAGSLAPQATAQDAAAPDAVADAEPAPIGRVATVAPAQRPRVTESVPVAQPREVDPPPRDAVLDATPEVEIPPEVQRTYEGLMEAGVKFLVAGRRAEAAAVLLEAHRLQPKNPVPHQRLCVILPHLGRTHEALTHCELWRAKEPDEDLQKAADRIIQELENEEK